MKTIQLSVKNVLGAVSQADIDALKPVAKESLKKLTDHSGLGNDFLGWVKLPSEIPAAELDDINATAAEMRKNCDTVVVIGIGGSYLGAKAVVEALSDSFAAYRSDVTPKILFAGQNIGEDYLAELTDYLKGKKFGVINISKSGTTTETALTFRLLKKQCEEQRGKEEAKKVIVAVTDAKKGAARTCADKEGYTSFIIPDNVGGRFSVLTPVGLLPIAVAGIDIDALMAGAADMMRECALADMNANPAWQYAGARYELYRTGKKIELLAAYEPCFRFMSEWWKQLYGESEGKENKGLFPASVEFTADLHSMGQYIQQGERHLFETVVRFGPSQNENPVPYDEGNGDGLNFLAGKSMDFIRQQAMDGTLLAHVEGGVPNVTLRTGSVNEQTLGGLIYFFEYACGLSGYLLDVNPFDQPGVEAYKKNMFALLGKPGYEDLRQTLLGKLEK